MVKWRYCGLISVDVQSQIPPSFLWTCLHCSCQLHSIDGFAEHLDKHRMDGIYLAVRADQSQLEDELESKVQLYEVDEQGVLAAVSSSAETKRELLSDSVIYEELTFDDASSTVCDELSSFQASVSKEQIESFAGAAEVHHVMLRKRERKDVMPEIMELGSNKSNQSSRDLPTSQSSCEEKCMEVNVDTSGEDGRKNASSRKRGRRSSVPLSLRLYICQVSDCHWKSKNHFNYHRHVFSHLKLQARFQCEYCHKEISSNSGKCGYGQKRFRCSECDIEPMTKSLCESHMLQVHHKAKAVKRHLGRSKRDVGESQESDYGCDKCAFSTKRKSALTLHQASHESLSDFLNCSHCQFSTDNRLSLTRHVSQKHQDHLTKSCTLCGAKVRTIAELKQHLQEVHSMTDLRLLCSKCGIILPSDEMHQTHLAEHHLGTLYICVHSQCEFSSYAKEVMQEHQLLDRCVGGREEITMVCGQCDFTTASRNAFKSHKLEHLVTNETLVCQFCSKSHESLDRLSCHVQQSHPADFARVECQCRLCGEFFESRHLLLDHQDLVHSLREMYVCETCSYTCRRKWNLIRHKLVAHEKLEVHCELCDYRTKSLVKMDKHYTLIHQSSAPDDIRNWVSSNIRKCRVPVQRKESFKYSGACDKIICDVCGKTVHRNLLRKHMERHNQIGAFKCQHDQCKYSSGSSYHLALHIRQRHSGDFSRVCSVCGHVSRNGTLHQRHLLRKHPAALQGKTTGQQTDQACLDSVSGSQQDDPLKGGATNLYDPKIPVCVAEYAETAGAGSLERSNEKMDGASSVPTFVTEQQVLMSSKSKSNCNE